MAAHPYAIVSVLKVTFLLLFTACIHNDYTSDDIGQGELTTIAGVVLDYDRYPNTKYVYIQKYEDAFRPFGNEARISKDGTFVIRFSQKHPGLNQLKPFLDKTIYTIPGDSVYVSISLDGDQPTIFSGNRKVENELLHKYYSEGYFGYAGDDLSKIIDSDPDTYLSHRTEIKDAFLLSLQRFEDTYSPPEMFVEFLESEILNQYYTRLYRYSNSQCSPINQEYDPEIRLRMSAHFFGEIETNLQSDIGKMTKHPSIEQTISSHIRNLMLTVDPGHRYRRMDPDVMLNVILKNEDYGILKDQMLLRVGKAFLEGQKLSAFERVSDRVMDNISDPILRQSLSQSYNQIKASIANLRPMSQFDLQHEREFSTILDSVLTAHSGKVIYMDFWTTWCKPCLIDILASQDVIQTEYKEQDVSFIHLCVGSDKMAHDHFVRENNLSGSYKFLHTEDAIEVSSIFNNSGYAAFPFHVILDKNHNVIKTGQYSLENVSTREILHKLVARNNYEE